MNPGRLLLPSALLVAGCAAGSTPTASAPSDGSRLLPEPVAAPPWTRALSEAPRLGSEAERRFVARALLLIEERNPEIFSLLEESAEFRGTTKGQTTPLATSLVRWFGTAEKGSKALRFDLGRLQQTPTVPEAEELDVLVFTARFRPISPSGLYRPATEVAIGYAPKTKRIAWLATGRGDFE